MNEEIWQISNPIIGIVVVAITFLLFYVVGYLSNRKQSSVRDLYVAGGQVGALTNGLAMSSTYMSLATFLGITALILNLQMPLIILWIQLILAIPLITIIYGTSLRRMGVISPTHFIRERYGVRACIIAAVFMIIISIMYALGQMIGVAVAFETLLGVPYIWGLFVGGIIIVGYITIGGMTGQRIMQLSKWSSSPYVYRATRGNYEGIRRLRLVFPTTFLFRHGSSHA
ncbi:hypothetical protein [Geomicrobium sp. JCM 19037]|uniref:sodium:solute symporter family transporter n=1 Tax=Geomicrobium sp. JCM 19037 TaxID=1460634 RepID=UPI000ADEDA5D|nr:hypothetical protein [Geomicrobium sp. JCM 19037]